MRAQPMVGNLAWAPLPAFEEVEVLDRFNGVPTLGVFGGPGDKFLFWRAFGYIPPQGISIWLYVPMTTEDEQHLACAEPSELLQGLIFQAQSSRRVTVGIAHDYRLIFEFEWVLPTAAPEASLLNELLDFILSQLLGVTKAAVAPSRKRAARRASKSVKQLAAV